MQCMMNRLSSMKKIADTFLPELDQRYKDQASAIVGDSMVRQIRKHRAVWYPGAEEMLTALKNRGYHLVILSNCKVAYRKAHWEEFRMERWFEQFYDCESYGFCPKTEIVQEVIRDYPGPYLVIGDRRQLLVAERAEKQKELFCKITSRRQSRRRDQKCDGFRSVLLILAELTDFSIFLKCHGEELIIRRKTST